MLIKKLCVAVAVEKLYRCKVEGCKGLNIEKSHIQETKNLSTDADRRTDSILERLSI